MRSKWLATAAWLALVTNLAADQYRLALPGYRYEFPRDYFNHEEFQTEWWYYTGNVKTDDGRRFGFQLTFFRQGVDRANSASVWAVRDLYFAHLALSDLDGGRFFHAERTNRAGPGIAGASEAERKIWNGNWYSAWNEGEQTLEAVAEEFRLHFKLHAAKPPVIHGENGVSQKASGPGHASHYISLTRLLTTGELEMGGKTFLVHGSSWMDHEFFTHQLDAGQVGWDWISVQLHDNTELMLFNIRHRDGSVDPYSSGTFVDASGCTTHLSNHAFSLHPAGEVWRSVQTGASYPVRWTISVPQLGIELQAGTPLKTQEMVGSTKLIPTYWEGAITLDGKKNDAPIRGFGYLEMTGYDRPVDSPGLSTPR